MPRSIPSSSIPPGSNPRSPPASEDPFRSQDPEKPAIPYTQGHTFTILRHIPPPPLGRPYPNSGPFTHIDTIQHMSQFEWCLKAPPLGGTTVHDDVSSFTITKELAVRDGRGAQLVAVDSGLVAKIYDPLYYPSYYEWTNTRADVVESAEIDYSREAAAYEEMGDRFGGTTPKYYGSWTCEVSVDTTMGITKRPVRLILIELIEGVAMRSLHPDKLSEEQKSNVMVKAINAIDTLHRHGIMHGDFAPRNVMCSGNDLASPRLRVVLIDFGQSIVRRLTTLPPLELLESPIARYWRRGPYQFEFQCSSWIPSPRGEWLWKHWGDSPLYKPVVRGQEKKPVSRPPEY